MIYIYKHYLLEVKFKENLNINVDLGECCMLNGSQYV